MSRARLPRGVVDVDGVRLTAAEVAVLHLLGERRLLSVKPNAWGSLEILSWLARRGLAAQCGRLFHATGPGDLVVAKLPPTAPGLFGVG